MLVRCTTCREDGSLPGNVGSMFESRERTAMARILKELQSLYTWFNLCGCAASVVTNSTTDHMQTTTAYAHNDSIFFEHAFSLLEFVHRSNRDSRPLHLAVHIHSP